MAQKFLIGAHVAMKGPEYLLGSLASTIEYKATAMMIYTGAPQNRVRTPLDKIYIEEFKKGCQAQDIALDDVVVHAPYLINLCSATPGVRESSIDLLRSELKRTAAIGAKYLVLHPGSSPVENDRAKAISDIAAGIDEAAKGVEGVFVALETMAGKGGEVGGTFEELHQIIKHAKTPVYVCVDTCHMNDADYDISKPDELVAKMDQTFGSDKVKVIHLNDSKNVRGARKDRHENLGYGTIGFQNLLKFAHHPRFADIPKILETAWAEDYYAEEIKTLREGKWYDFKKNAK